MPLGDSLQGLTVLIVVVIGSMLVGRMFRAIGQPSVLGPITFGIVVGALVVALPASARAAIVPETSHHLLEAVGTAGLLLLMFAVGAELRAFSGSGGTSGGWRLVPCVLLPMIVCGLVAWPFAGHLASPGHAHLHGWLFMGVALGVTAVPVLALIIKDLGIGSLVIAGMALHVAVVTDGAAWVLVSALLVAGTDLAAVSVPALAVGAAMLAGTILVAPRVIRRAEATVRGGTLVAMIVVCVLAAAASTQLLGLHPAVGAVIAGFLFPAPFPDASSQRTFDSLIDVLLPAFFVSAAMAVPVQSLHEHASWHGMCCTGALAVAAFGSKLASGLLFGAMHRWPWRSSGGLGVLLNCRGVTEIAIASVGFQARLIGSFGFAILCGIAIATTAVTAPLYRAVTGGHPAAAGAAQRAP